MTITHHPSNRDAESPFTFDELFFSRTDARGVILSGNSTFQRVSQFAWEALIHRPHNVIRHPDMPKGVFQLFWDTIKSGHPIGAFVKNQSKNGSYYWVYALALPVRDGYLSIRLKPSGKLFEIAKQEYKKLIALEKSEKLSPIDSMNALLADLKTLGFENYSKFMVAGLAEELAARQQKLGRPPIALLEKLQELSQSGEKLQRNFLHILETYRGNAFIPLNLEIATNKIGSQASSLAVVASKYDAMAKDIKAEIFSFASAADSIRQSVEQCRFEVCASLLESEVSGFFKSEKNYGPVDVKVEMDLLDGLKGEGNRKSIHNLRNLERDFGALQEKCRDLRALSLGLEIVRLTGRIEAVKIDEHAQELNDLIENLAKFRKFVSTALDNLNILSEELKGLAGTMADDIAT